MADNVISDAGSGGATWATDECTVNSVLVHVPWCKLGYGTFDTFTAVTSSAGLPVAQQGTWNITNISGTVSLPTGAATLAEQQTQTASLSVIDDWDESDRAKVNLVVGQAGITAGAGAVAASTPRVTLASDDPAVTALQLIDNAISGSEMQVDIVAALPAGTNNIGDVDVLSVVPGTGATSLGKAEDAGHASGDTGVMSLAVRSDSDASLCGTDLDYTPLQVDANGYLKVNIKAGAGSGGTASTDDAAFTAASGSGTPMMGFVTSDSVDSGDVGVVGMLANRQLKVTLYDSGGVELAVGGGTQYTEDAAAAANPVGNSLIMVRADSLAGVTSADGDNVAARGTDKGELYVKHVDTIAATQSGTWNVTNISGTVSLPTGAATAANQATIIGHVDGLEGLLTTIDADTGALAGCVGGTELQVDIVAMPAVDTELTTADLDTGAGTDTRAVVGLVGSASGGGQLIPGSATDGLLVNLGANNDVVVSGTVAATQSGTWNVTNVSGTVSLPTGASTLAEQQTQTTSLQLLDDIVATLGTTTYTETTTKGAVIGAVRKDAAGTLANTDNEIAPLQLNANGQLRVDASAVAVPATQSGTWNIGTVTTVTTVSAVTSITNAVTVVGNAAHDAAVSGNPVLNAAEARTSESAVSASGDVVRLMADLVGKLVTMPYAPTDLQWQGTGSKTDTTDLAIKAAAGAGIRNYITDLICANSSATNVTVIVKDGSTEIARLPVPANGGVVHRFSTPLKGTANTAINLASSASATTIYMTATGFTGR